MSAGGPSDKFKDYLDKIEHIGDDKCWFCKKTPDDIRREFFEYMQNPDEEFEDIELEDIAIMSYKLKKPICASCYFNIKQNPGLVDEVIKSSETDVW